MQFKNSDDALEWCISLFSANRLATSDEIDRLRVAFKTTDVFSRLIRVDSTAKAYISWVQRHAAVLVAHKFPTE